MDASKGSQKIISRLIFGLFGDGDGDASDDSSDCGLRLIDAI